MRHTSTSRTAAFALAALMVGAAAGTASAAGTDATGQTARTAAPTGAVFTNGFDDLATGPASDADIKGSWNSRYAKGPDEGRVEIVADGHTGNAARVKYPAGGNQSSPSGATWATDLGGEMDEAYLDYWVKFDADFQFVKGGKLPGLAGSTGAEEKEFTTRLMWREGGKLEFYLHGYEMNNTEGAEPYRVSWDDFGSHATLVPGRWHHIQLHQKLNTPGQRDGLLQGWLDGKLVAEDTSNSGTRGAGSTDTHINNFYFSTFFGGSSAPASQWQPKKDVYATFDDVTVSGSPIAGGVAVPAKPAPAKPAPAPAKLAPEAPAPQAPAPRPAPGVDEPDNLAPDSPAPVDSAGPDREQREERGERVREERAERGEGARQERTEQLREKRTRVARGR